MSDNASNVPPSRRKALERPSNQGRQSPRRVAVVHQYALPTNQGGGTRHVELFGALGGWQTNFIAGDTNYQTGRRFHTEDQRFTLLPVPSHDGNGVRRVWGWCVFAGRAGVRLFRMPNVDLIYASTPQLLVPAACALVARLRRLPLIVEIRDLWPETLVAANTLRRGRLLHRILEGLERWVVRQADKIVVVTPGWLPHLKRLGVNPNNVVTIPNGATPPKPDLIRRRNEFRLKYRLSNLTAVYAGAHGPANGLSELLDAASQLTHVTFLLIGDGSHRQALRADAERRMLENVRFIDSMPKEELMEILTAADIGIHCISPLSVLLAGMSPNKLFDYLACGLPVVSNAGPALETVIKDGQVGTLVAHDRLVDGLLDVIAADEDDRAKWKRNGRALLSSGFSREAAAATLEQLLDSSLPSR